MEIIRGIYEWGLLLMPMFFFLMIGICFVFMIFNRRFWGHNCHPSRSHFDSFHRTGWGARDNEEYSDGRDDVEALRKKVEELNNEIKELKKK